MMYLLKNVKLPITVAEIPLYSHTFKKKKKKNVFLAVLSHVINQFNLHNFQDELPARAVVVVVVTGYKQGGLTSLKMPNPL